ncbi:MAG: RseA family anti-sigma factor [Telluria sp.]
MDTNRKIREHISALVDGELPCHDLEVALATLQEPDPRAAWGLYHLVGDALRAAPAPEPPPGFEARLAARLAAEAAAPAPAAASPAGAPAATPASS